MSEFPATHNPKVAGSNPAPATKKIQILNGFREFTGGRFPVWREFRQILGKEFLVQKRSKLPRHANIVCCHQMRVGIALNQGELGKTASEQRQELSSTFNNLGDVLRQRINDVANRSIAHVCVRYQRRPSWLWLVEDW